LIVAQRQSNLAKLAASVNYLLTRPPRLILIDAPLSSCLSRHILSTTPRQFEPMHRRKINDGVDPHPWCQGFYAAMRLRISAWAPLLDASNVNHGLLLPILLHCCDDQGCTLLGPPRSGRETRRAHADIPAAVEALRQYWMPIRYAR